MLTPRKAIAIMLAFFAISVLASVYNLTKTPDKEGLGQDSYGTRAHGFRGFYETLEGLGVSSKRAFVPPPYSLQKNDTVVLLAPNGDLVEHEPEYLRQTMKWVENGGHAVIALKGAEQWWHRRHNKADEDEGTSLPEVLGLPHLHLVSIKIKNDERYAAQDEAAEIGRRSREHLSRFHVTSERETGVTTVSLRRALAGLNADVKQLRIPVNELQVMERTTGTEDLAGEVTVASDDGVNYTLAAVATRGKGTLTFVSDAALFVNHLLPEMDNPVLAVNLVARDGRRVVFDEFYHGLNVRGNPLWLLTQPHYGMVLLAILLGLALWIWREATVLGPPLPERKVSRRSLGEYLEAMATLFLRARHRRFLLRELRTGVLWSLRQRLNLPPGQENVHSISVALERNDPVKARRLKAASAAIDGLLSDKRTVPEETFIEAAREIARCR